MSPDLGTFGAVVRRYRLRAGLTQRAVAEKVGIDHTYLSKLENGHDMAGEQTIRRLAELLGADADELLRLSGNQEARIEQLEEALTEIARESSERDDAPAEALASVHEIARQALEGAALPPTPPTDREERC